MRRYEDIKITVVGMGYVGLSLAVTLSKHHNVMALDIDEKKISLINQKCTPFKDEYLNNYLREEELKLYATANKEEAYRVADYIFVAVPTNFDCKANAMDTTIVESVVMDIRRVNSKASIVIKSTVPIGFTNKLKNKFGIESIFFCPEFLRETTALYDTLYPSRIIVSTPGVSRDDKVEILLKLLVQGCLKKDIKTIFMDSAEAESVKLFSNTFLAMRIAFFNELDMYADSNDLRTDVIIDGICADPRIGDWYNNPSFGYGGYCLPKDSKQLLSSYGSTPQKMISAIVESNQIRKQYIVNKIISKVNELKRSVPNKNVIVGIYRLTMKTESDNFRESAVYDMMEELKKHDLQLIVYEPLICAGCNKFKINNKIADFINVADIIVANRIDEKLEDVREKVISRDLFGRD